MAADRTVKISDFGMARDINYHEYYRKNGQALLPVRCCCVLCISTHPQSLSSTVTSDFTAC